MLPQFFKIKINDNNTTNNKLLFINKRLLLRVPNKNFHKTSFSVTEWTSNNL